MSWVGGAPGDEGRSDLGMRSCDWAMSKMQVFPEVGAGQWARREIATTLSQDL